MRSELLQKHTASKSTIDKFVEDTSGKYLVKIALPLLDNWNRDVLEGCVKVFYLRNQILHAPRMKVSEKESEESIRAVESFLGIIDKRALWLNANVASEVGFVARRFETV